jgi:uncharacterized membrane protein YcaP (DUF421 family)
VIAEFVQQGVTQEDYSVTGAVLAVGTFALMIVATSWVSWRFPRARPILETSGEISFIPKSGS